MSPDDAADKLLEEIPVEPSDLPLDDTRDEPEGTALDEAPSDALGSPPTREPDPRTFPK